MSLLLCIKPCKLQLNCLGFDFDPATYFFQELCNNTWTSKLWPSQLWMQLSQLGMEACGIQYFNGVWARDLTVTVRRFNGLRYEATDVRSWSFVASNKPVRIEGMMKWSMKHIIYWTANAKWK